VSRGIEPAASSTEEIRLSAIHFWLWPRIGRPGTLSRGILIAGSKLSHLCWTARSSTRRSAPVHFRSHSTNLSKAVLTSLLRCLGIFHFRETCTPSGFVRVGVAASKRLAFGNKLDEYVITVPAQWRVWGSRGEQHVDEG
jgi:hypothetical protein